MSKCECKRGDFFGPEEGGNLVHDKKLFVYKATESVGPGASVADVTKQTPQFLPGNTYVIPGYPRAQYGNLIYPGTPF